VKILVLIYEYPPIGGGGGPACEGLCVALAEAGHEVTVITSKMKGLQSHEIRSGVEIYRVPCVRRSHLQTAAWELLSWMPTATRKANELLRSQPFDLVHAHFLVPCGAVARRVTRRSGVPYVLTAHGSDVPGYNRERLKVLHRILRPAWLRIVEDSAAVTTPSRFLAGLIQDAQPNAVPIVIPNAIEVSRSAPRSREKRILVVSRILERKGVQHVISAMPSLSSEWELVIAGDGPYLPTLREQASKLETRVRFLGMVPRELLPQLYQSSEIFVLPSARENFPMVLLEAMAGGCAIVTTRGSGCEEVVGDAARLVDTDDPAQLRVALDGLIVNEFERRALGERARRRVDQFAAPAVAQRVEELFREVLRGSTGQRNAAETQQRGRA
jgi:glycosyltransferase involved in cell wall biosynthesis